MIRHIIFDLGNVLVNIHPERTVNKFSKYCGHSIEKVKSFYLSDLHLGFMAGKYQTDEFFTKMMEKYPCDIDKSGFIEIWDEVIGRTKDGIPEIVESLQGRCRLSVCSNTDPWHWEFAMKTMPVLKKFENYFLSFEMKLNKPDSRVFKKILAELSAAGEDCIFIDDTEENIEAARQFGIHGIRAHEPEKMASELKRLLN